MKKVRVLFVCLGNICRSPLAAAIFRHKIARNGMDGWVETDSCGTSDYHIGDDADPRTRANAKQHGIPIEHCVRQLTTEDLDAFDYIFAMDKSNYNNIKRLSSPQHAGKIFMMRRFDVQRPDGEVPDPYHGGAQGFEEVFRILDRSTTGFIDFLKQEYRSNLEATGQKVKK